MDLYFKLHNKRLFSLEYYYVIVVLAYFLSIFIPSIRPGIIATLLMFYIFSKPYFITNSKRLRTCSGLIIVFFIYNILSIIGYLYNGIGISAYWQDMSNQMLPILFFFLPLESINIERFYFNTLIILVFALVVGLYFFYNPTSQYLELIARTSDPTYEGKIGNVTQRFQSIFGSTITGSFSLIVMIISNSFLVNGIKYSKRKEICLTMVYLLGFICAILTSQRSAMVLAIFMMIVPFFFCFFYKKTINRTFLVVYILVLIYVVLYILPIIPEYLDFYIERLDSVSSAMDGRDIQWQTVLKNSPNILFGTGLGSVGHKAAPYTKYIITDGALFKYIAEFGIIGSSIFYFSILSILVRNIRRARIFYIEYLIIAICLLQSIGSNTICFQLILPLFWFSLGRISYCTNKYSTILY